jgi:hypothetical protein
MSTTRIAAVSTTVREPTGRPPVRRATLRLPPSWPVWAGVGAYPIWWALGIAHLILPILAIPVGWYLWQRYQVTGTVRVPPGFAWWLLFLACVVISAVALNQTAPGTLEPQGLGRILSYGLRLAHYVALTLFMLYVGNMSERALPRLSVLRAIGALGVGMIGLGFLAMAFPNGSFRTPYALVMPGWLGGEGPGTTAVLAQVQDLVSGSGARPAAPFAFTNTWGAVLSLTLVWLVVGWIVVGRPRRRLAGLAIVGASVIPIVYSLNRGVWLAVVVAGVYVAVRFAIRGRVAALAGLVAIAAVLGGLMLTTPLGTVITERVGNPHSDQVRGWLSERAWEAATASPVLGYGSTRDTEGSQQSIAVGQAPDCPQCGNRVVGSTGHLWLLLISQGIVGAALYVGYFARSWWAYRRDHSAIGIAGTLTIVMSLYYLLFYTALNVVLLIVMLSIALLWRNDDARNTQAAVARVGSGAVPR